MVEGCGKPLWRPRVMGSKWSSWRPAAANVLPFIRYCVIGGLTFVVFVLVNRAVLAFPAVPASAATAIAIVAAGTANFAGHHWFTFRSDRAVEQALPRYCALLLFNAGAGAAIVGFLAGCMGLSLVIANGICLAAITVWTFFAMRWLVM